MQVVGRVGGYAVYAGWMYAAVVCGTSGMDDVAERHGVGVDVDIGSGGGGGGVAIRGRNEARRERDTHKQSATRRTAAYDASRPRRP